MRKLGPVTHLTKKNESTLRVKFRIDAMNRLPVNIWWPFRMDPAGQREKNGHGSEIVR